MLISKILIAVVIISLLINGVIVVIGSIRKWKLFRFPTGFLAKCFPYLYIEIFFGNKADQVLMYLYIITGIISIMAGMWITIYTFFP
jgi:hypothetical protein